VDLDKKQWNSRILYITTWPRPQASFRVSTLWVRVVTLTWLLQQLNLRRNLQHKKIFQHNSSLFLAILNSGLSLMPHMHTPYCNTVYEYWSPGFSDSETIKSVLCSPRANIMFISNCTYLRDLSHCHSARRSVIFAEAKKRIKLRD
jgi:hypothetical protein